MGELESLFIGAGKIWAVDPALRNFSLSNEELKLNLRIDFGTPAMLYKALPLILRLAFGASGQGSVLIGERQINKHRNPNVRYEYFMRGAVAALGGVRYVDVPAHAKRQMAREAFQWEYEKCASKKAFVRACGACSSLREAAGTWKCFSLTVRRGTFHLARFDSPMHQKKFDDFVDTLVLLKARHA